eukprot:scaffold25518_cov74-Phaeocystis_antarctica.AAC.4
MEGTKLVSSAIVARVVRDTTMPALRSAVSRRALVPTNASKVRGLGPSGTRSVDIQCPSHSVLPKVCLESVLHSLVARLRATSEKEARVLDTLGVVLALPAPNWHGEKDVPLRVQQNQIRCRGVGAPSEVPVHNFWVHASHRLVARLHSRRGNERHFVRETELPLRALTQPLWRGHDGGVVPPTRQASDLASSLLVTEDGLARAHLLLHRAVQHLGTHVARGPEPIARIENVLPGDSSTNVVAQAGPLLLVECCLPAAGSSVTTHSPIADSDVARSTTADSAIAALWSGLIGVEVPRGGGTGAGASLSLQPARSTSSCIRRRPCRAGRSDYGRYARHKQEPHQGGTAARATAGARCACGEDAFLGQVP